MAPFRGFAPWGDQYNSVRATATTLLQRVHLYGRPRARPARALILTLAACFFLYVCLSAPLKQVCFLVTSG